MSNTPNTYAYPVGDFLSGFSEDPKIPCDYELECQRMVILGMQYFDQNPDLHEKITQSNKLDVFDPMLQDLVAHMIKGEDGQTGAMVSHTVMHAYHAYRLGWDEYIKQITEHKDDEQQ